MAIENIDDDWVTTSEVTGEWTPCVSGFQSRTDTREQTRIVTQPCIIPPVPTFKMEKFPINMESMLVFAIQHASSSGYERFQNYQEITQAANKLSFHHLSMNQGSKPLGGALYTLAVDGVNNATVTPAPGAISAIFTLDLNTIPDGWHKVEIKSPIATETSAPWCVFVNRAGTPLLTPPTKMPVCAGSYDWSQRPGKHYLGWTPPIFAPTPRPLATRDCPPFSTTIPKEQLFLESVVPNVEGNIWLPNKTKNGVMTTFNEQAYMWQVPKTPPWSMLDGPRGVGTVTFPTHLQVGHTGGTYGCEQHRIFQVTNSGAVRTLAGYRDVIPPTHWKEQRKYELIGDWSAIPAERHGFIELWGMAWDRNSLATDPTAPPIGGIQPHVVGPRLFAADSQHNRIVLLQFKKDSFDPPVVTEWITGLGDSWDIIWDDDKLYISERKAHKISTWSALTPQTALGTLVQGSDLSSVDPQLRMSKWHAGVTLAQVRAAPGVAFEGLYLLDSWLYYGSLAMWCIKKINLATKEIRSVTNVDIQGNSKFLKFCVSDGTFGPRGMIAWASWSNWMGGRPSCIVPGQPYWNWQGYARLFRGKGGLWNNTGYTSAVAIGLGRMVYGSSELGLCRISKALPTDPTIDMAKYARGEEFYMDKGYHFTHGKHGYGYVGLPLPFGENADMDYYLTTNGLS